MKNPVYPCLWFDGKAKEAADFYCANFKNSKIISDPINHLYLHHEAHQVSQSFINKKILVPLVWSLCLCG